MTVDMVYPTPLPSTKGWGIGWTQADQTCTVARTAIIPSPIFQGGVREEIAELVELIVTEAERRGYIFHKGWSWGFGCRATKGGSGTTPSFHSWGLALDVNAPANPFTDKGSPEDSDIATNNRWLVQLFAAYDFFWLGPEIGDWMHFHYAGSRQDAAQALQRARDTLTPIEEDGVNLEKYDDGWSAFVARAKDKGSDPGPAPAEWSTWKKKGWSAARFAYNNPKTA